MKTDNNTALTNGLMRCHDCGALSQISSEPPYEHLLETVHCKECGSHVHPRTPNSFRRVSALIMSAFIVYIPANIFPIMTVTKFGSGDPHTIVGGIVALVNSEMIPIAILVFVASILVPLLKLVGLTLLLLIVRYRWRVNCRIWSGIYRSIAFVGRWSMLDIFMISILVSLVDIGGVAQILAGPAATAFATVVVLTMFAANYFDPRLLWDSQENTHEN